MPKTGSTPMCKPMCKHEGIIVNMVKAWVGILSIGASIFGIISLKVLNSRSTTISPPDMVDVKSTVGGYMTFLCGGIHIKSWSDSFTGYRLNQTPQIDHSGRDKFYLKEALSVYEAFAKRSFNVIEGSELTAKICSKGQSVEANETLKVLVFQGRENFDDWDKTKQTNGAAIQTHRISSNYDCSKNNSYQIYLNAPTTDNYFFVYVKESAKLTILGNLEYDLNLVRYDVRAASVACQSVTSCDITFAFNSENNVVLQFEPVHSEIIFQSSCTYRIGVCWAMFLALPAGVALLWTGLVLLCGLKERNTKQSNSPINVVLQSVKKLTNTTDYNTVCSESNPIS